MSIKKLKRNEVLFLNQKHFSVAAMFQHLSEDTTEMNFKKDIDELLLQTNVSELKKVAVIMKINLDEEEDLQLCQFLRIP